jgi:hypothetical protein
MLKSAATQLIWELFAQIAFLLNLPFISLIFEKFAKRDLK